MCVNVYKSVFTHRSLEADIKGNLITFRERTTAE